MKTWKLGKTKQCAKCPWRVGVNPHEIPNGYSVEKHRNLESTIAKEGDISTLGSRNLAAMACHESGEKMFECVGWVHNQAGVGNNIALRLKLISCANANELEVFGEQHERFEDTLPT